MPASPVAPQSVSAAAIELQGLVKDFAIGLRGVKLRAVDHLTLRIEPGQVFGLLGPNGSGKSTTIKLLLGLLAPTAGRGTIFGVPSERADARRTVGYLPEAPYFYGHLTGFELVRFYARLSGLDGRALDEGARAAIDRVEMTGAADRLVRNYSKGMLQRIGLAQAIVHQPQLLILDEPTAGVDPAGAAMIARLVLELKAEGKTVLITSHLLAQMEEVCDGVAILDRGRLIYQGRMADLPGRGNRQAMVLDALPPGELEELRAWLAARGRALHSVETPRAQLERVYLERVGKQEQS